MRTRWPRGTPSRGLGAGGGGTGRAPSVVRRGRGADTARGCSSVTAYPRRATSFADLPSLPRRALQQGAEPRQRGGQPGVQVDAVQPGDRYPGHAHALAVQPQVGGLDRAGRAGQHGGVGPAAVVVHGMCAQDEVVRGQPQLLPHLAQRSVVRGLAVVEGAARRPPRAAVVGPPRPVLQQDLEAGRPVPVQEQTGGPGAAPVPVSLGADRPAVGGGEHPSSEPGPRKLVLCPLIRSRALGCTGEPLDPGGRTACPPPRPWPRSPDSSAPNSAAATGTRSPRRTSTSSPTRPVTTSGSTST